MGKGRIDRSVALFSRSMQVLKDNKKLYVFPLLTALVVLGLVATPFAACGLHVSYTDDDGREMTLRSKPWLRDIETVPRGTKESVEQSPRPTGTECPDWVAALAIAALVGGLWAMFVAGCFVAMFLSVGCVHEIMQALNGNRVSIVRGFRVALSKSGSVFLWALLAGTIGTIIKIIELLLQDSDVEATTGVFSLLGAGFGVASLFAAPVILREEKTIGPFACLKKSAGVIRKTWGESLLGCVRLTIWRWFAVLLPIAVYAAARTDMPLLADVTVGLATFALIVLLHVLFNVAEKIYLSGLYVYAAEGVLPMPFDKETLDMAWVVKKKRKKKDKKRKRGSPE